MEFGDKNILLKVVPVGVFLLFIGAVGVAFLTPDNQYPEYPEIAPNKPLEIEFFHISEVETDSIRIEGFVKNINHDSYVICHRVCFVLLKDVATDKIPVTSHKYGVKYQPGQSKHEHKYGVKYQPGWLIITQVAPNGKWEVDIPHFPGYVVHFIEGFLAEVMSDGSYNYKRVIEVRHYTTVL